MTQLIRSFVVYSLIVCSLVIPAFAGVSSFELINNPAPYNNKTIIYEGEAIGDIMDGWINVNDGNAAIGVFATDRSQLEKIKFLGNYKNKGDRLRIEGIFNQACARHGGDLDIHTNKIEIIRVGQKIDRKPDLTKLLSIMILAITMMILYMIKTIHEKT
ncbi:DNA-binding protein [Candidatus Margulisiibacteriota bacterium]